MAGQGYAKVRKCLHDYGPGFRKQPVQKDGLLWCRGCGYQIALHEKLERQALACPHGGQPDECPVLGCGNSDEPVGASAAPPLRPTRPRKGLR